MRSASVVVWGSILVLAGLMYAGCGGSGDACVSFCTDAKASTCASNGAPMDCSAWCSAWQQIASASGCSAERTAEEDCWAAQSNVCQAVADPGPCGFSANQPGHAFESCVTPYCVKHSAQCDAADML